MISATMRVQAGVELSTLVSLGPVVVSEVSVEELPDSVLSVLGSAVVATSGLVEGATTGAREGAEVGACEGL